MVVVVMMMMMKEEKVTMVDCWQCYSFIDVIFLIIISMWDYHCTLCRTCVLNIESVSMYTLLILI